MVIRTIHNTGSPFRSPDGTILSWLKITFILVDRDCKKIDVFDTQTGEKFAGEVEVRTDENGEFSVELFPNTRGDKESYYLVHVNHRAFVDFKSALAEGDSPIDFMTFRYGGVTINPAEYNLIQQYIDESEEKFGTSVYTQTEPVDTWIIEHNMDRYPSVTAVDDTGETVIPSSTIYDSSNQITLTFPVPVSGTAYLN